MRWRRRCGRTNPSSLSSAAPDRLETDDRQATCVADEDERGGEVALNRSAKGRDGEARSTASALVITLGSAAFRADHDVLWRKPNAERVARQQTTHRWPISTEGFSSAGRQRDQARPMMLRTGSSDFRIPLCIYSEAKRRETTCRIMLLRFSFQISTRTSERPTA